MSILAAYCAFVARKALPNQMHSHHNDECVGEEDAAGEDGAAHHLRKEALFRIKTRQSGAAACIPNRMHACMHEYCNMELPHGNTTIT